MAYGLLMTFVMVYTIQVATREWGGESLHREFFVLTRNWPGQPWTLFTSTLSHGDLGHLIMNALFLVIVGPQVEQILGKRRFLIAFFSAGAIAGLLQLGLAEFVYDVRAGVIGASGALMMVFGILVTCNPRHRFGPEGVTAPVWALGSLYVVFDLLGVFVPDTGIGHMAHL